ncbi:MAG: FapA family protein [Spirochaetales bacterium]|nr:FapA family protein [Spirochaetales bacterium]
MISLTQLREYMLKQSEKDRKNKSVQVTGETIDEALRNASIELGLPVTKLKYEILQKGNKGMFGVGKRDWTLIAYEAFLEEELANVADNFISDNIINAEEKKDVNGEAFVKLTHDGVFLKVTKPVGKGLVVQEKRALEKIERRGVVKFDVNLVAKVVRRAEGRYIRVGEFDYNPANDSAMSIDILEMEMKSYIEVSAPRLGGADLTYENMVGILKNNGIVFGIKEDTLKKFEDYPEYNMQILAAEGAKPVNGRDAQIVYYFNTDRNSIKLKEEDGRVDFKELNLIENVVAGQVLAKKIPPEKGEEGRTITGKVLPAKPGKDINIPVGKNVKLSEDGTTVISEINGQAILLNGKINVEPVFTVSGDVNLQTGNILFLGTVIVKGSVLDGFSVKAAGNIEVKGNVGKCILDAEGDVIVHQGILGKDGGNVKSGKSIFAKFIEHARVEATEYVYVNEGILHSFVDANKKIICQGRRASIVGGRLRASEEINAKHLGSIAGTETILEVGYDPASKARLAELDSKLVPLKKELDEIELNIKTLMNLKKVQRKLSEEKEEYLEELNSKRIDVQTQIQVINTEMEDIRSHLVTLKKDGKISASEKVFPGVKLYIKDSYLEVKNEFKFVTFLLEHSNIRITKYEPIEEEFKKRGVY